MAWIYLQESEESPLPWTRGSSPSPIVKMTDSLNLSCYHGWLRDQSQVPPFGMMLKRSPESTSEESRSISYPVDFRARISAMLGAALAWRVSEAVYSSRSLGSLANFDRRSSSWRMCQLSLLGEAGKSSESLPKTGMIADGVLSPLREWEPTIAAKDGSYLPTPLATDATVGGIIGEADTFKTTSSGTIRRYNRSGHNASLNLSRWVQFWPTPRASDGKGAQKPSQATAKRILNSPNLPEVVVESLRPHGGKLNPHWVGWLMGFPNGWTDLDATGMQWFLSRRARRSRSSCSEVPTAEANGDD
jgi:hypothetical protein